MTIWSYLEVLDLTYNKLNDYDEILELINGIVVRKDVIKMVAIKGNSFYNYIETEQYSINNELEG
jgi:hypothetical protein